MGAPLWGQVCTTALTSALASAEFEAHLCMNLDWTNGNGVFAHPPFLISAVFF
jgi:hypothetical protein